MSNSTVKPISDEDRKLWERQNIIDLLECADLPFTRKIQMLEEMDEVIRSIHKEKRLPSADEHEELRW